MTEYVFDALIIILLFGVFGFLHSLLASNRVKNYFVKKFGKLIAFYRVAYNIFAILLFYFIYTRAPRPHTTIYDLNYPFDFIILIPQFLSLAGIFWALRYFCVKEFLGINQIKRYFNGTYDTGELDENLTLRIKGPYKFSRHPLYLFSILFLVFRPIMDYEYLIFLICIIAYFYIGSHYEEKKLIEKFGDQYLHYKKNVPRIFPIRLFKPYKKTYD